MKKRCGVRIIAVSNIKGGVGKTTTAVNLAYLSARGGARTVLWDLDSQGAASWILQAEEKKRTTVRQLLDRKRDLDEIVVDTEYENLHVIPADFSYRKFDAKLAERSNPTKRLLRMAGRWTSTTTRCSWIARRASPCCRKVCCAPPMRWWCRCCPRRCRCACWSSWPSSSRPRNGRT